MSRPEKKEAEGVEKILKVETASMKKKYEDLMESLSLVSEEWNRARRAHDGDGYCTDFFYVRQKWFLVQKEAIVQFDIFSIRNKQARNQK